MREASDRKGFTQDDITSIEGNYYQLFPIYTYICIYIHTCIYMHIFMELCKYRENMFKYLLNEHSEAWAIWGMNRLRNSGLDVSRGEK